MTDNTTKYLYKTLKSIQKWCGGEQEGIEHIIKYIPSCNRYIDPFFGAGTAYFTVKPDVQSFVNNTDNEIFQFYRLLQKKKFKTELDFFIDSWQLIKDFFKLINKDVQWSFNELITGDLQVDELPFIVRAIIITNTENPLVSNLFTTDFIIDIDNFINTIIDAVLKKLKRLYSQNKKKGIEYTKAKLDPHIETAVKNAYFIHFKKIFNDCKAKNSYKIAQEKIVAIWIILMILSKKSNKVKSANMFGFTYGGENYNHKNIRHRINSFFSNEIVDLLKHTHIYNLEFDEFIRNINPDENDFLLVNPPLNNKNNTNELIANQQHLVTNLSKLKSKWLFLTNKTPFTNKIKQQPGIIIEDLKDKNVKKGKIPHSNYTIVRNYTI